MKVQCGQCPAKYAVADERIRDKKVRIRCKRCNAAIVVDGKVEPPLVTSTPARKSAHPLPSSPPESFPPPEDRDPKSRPSPRPVAHTIMGGLEAPAAERLREVQLSPPGSNQFPMASGAGLPAPDRGFTDPPVGAVANRWRVALTKQDLRWMTTSEIREAYRAGAVKLETFVFRTGMPTWVTLLEVPEIAKALADEPAGGEPLARRPPSSRPPPRKSPGRREELRPDEGRRGTADDSGEEAPFALSAGRANGLHAQPYAGSFAADHETNPTLPPEFIETDTAQGSQAETADRPVPNDAHERFQPSPAEPDLARSGPGEPAAPAPFEAAQRSSGVSLWVWLILVVLVLAAAGLLLGPRLGLGLR